MTKDSGVMIKSVTIEIIFSVLRAYIKTPDCIVEPPEGINEARKNRTIMANYIYNTNQTNKQGIKFIVFCGLTQIYSVTRLTARYTLCVCV